MRLGKDNKRKRHANEFMRSSFTNSGRIAGIGISYDDYSEESYNRRPGTDYFPDPKIQVPLTEEERRFRDEGGPVITYNLKDKEG